MDKCKCGHPKGNHAGAIYLDKNKKLVEENNECAVHNCGCKKYVKEEI